MKKIKKDSPTSSSVHVNTPLGDEEKPILPEVTSVNTPRSMDASESPPVDNLRVEKGFNQDSDIRDMQQIVEGTDYELEGANGDQDLAQQRALENLSDDPDFYKKFFYTQDKTLEKDTSQTDEEAVSNWPVGVNLDLCSGTNRERGYVGLDLYPHDNGTMVHDLNLGIPTEDGVAKNVRLVNGLQYIEDADPKAIMSEIQRVLMPTGEFYYEGPNEIENYPDSLVQTDFESNEDVVEKGDPWYKQRFTRVATPDAATANDAEPRVGISQYDQLPADALLAMDALGYYWSDSTSSGRGNREHGYPSQGALLTRSEEDEANNLGTQKSLFGGIERDDDDGIEKCGGPGSGVPGPCPIGEKKDVGGSKTESKPDEHAKTEGGRWYSGGDGGSRESKAVKVDVKPDYSIPGYVSHTATVHVSDSHQVKLQSQPVRSSDSAKSHAEATSLAHAYANKNGFKVAKSLTRKNLDFFLNFSGDWDESPKIVPDQRFIEIQKADKMKQVVYCVVLTPDELDGQDDWMTAGDIEDAAHQYLLNSRKVKGQHEKEIDAQPVESYIAPQDMEWETGPHGPQVVKKGAWVLGLKVFDAKEWAKVMDGTYTGFSIGGLGTRT